MCPLDYPAPCFLPHIPFEFLCLFSPRPDMEGKAEFFSELDDIITNISCIETEVLLPPLCGRGSCDYDLLDRWSSKSHVMAIRSLNDDAEGDSLGVREHAAFGTTLGSVDGAWPRFFFPRAELW